MSRAHNATWWGSLDSYTFGVWINQDKIFDLPDSHNTNFLFLRSLVQLLGEDHRAYVRSVHSDQDRFLAQTAFSVYAHEWRHWYDATSTPFGLCRTAQLSAFFATIAGVYEEIGEYERLHSPQPGG